MLGKNRQRFVWETEGKVLTDDVDFACDLNVEDIVSDKNVECTKCVALEKPAVAMKEKTLKGLRQENVKFLTLTSESWITVKTSKKKDFCFKSLGEESQNILKQQKGSY